MASFISSASASVMNGRDEVYVATVPLRATKGPAQLLMSTAYSLNLSWDLQHFMVIIKPCSLPDSIHKALVYDFQPRDPQSIFVAIEALSGRKVSGVVQVRRLRKLPKSKCWFVGHSKENAEDATHKFNENWETDLRIGHNDCRHYTEGLVQYLTGEKVVLDHLRNKRYYKISNDYQIDLAVISSVQLKYVHEISWLELVL